MKMRFVVDAMLGRLARWLRIMGFDVLYPKDLTDDQLVELANREERTLLTKDRPLVREKKVDGYLVHSQTWEDQLREVLDEFNLRDQINPFSRCPECNQLLGVVSKERVAKSVPELVSQSQDQFYHCSGCHRIYWNGTHVERMIKKLDQILS
ncbi:MAG: Mut7-C RNAse domain-containing protein [Acidobacteria bacterium]|nr:Mut7-C RNAse domain-containing protein [Acidobacteriota bacterium]